MKLVLKRHWLDAEIMPYVLRYVGIATVTDPALAATISTLGLFLRQGGDPIRNFGWKGGKNGKWLLPASFWTCGSSMYHWNNCGWSSSKEKETRVVQCA